MVLGTRPLDRSGERKGKGSDGFVLFPAEIIVHLLSGKKIPYETGSWVPYFVKMLDDQDIRDGLTDSAESDNVRSRRLASRPVDPREVVAEEDADREVGRSTTAGAEKRRTRRAQPTTDREADNAPDESGPTEPKPHRPFPLEDYIGQVLSGNILTRAEVRRRYPYIFFMALLMLLYIANGYHIQKLHRRHDKLTAQLKELRSRSLTLSSIRMTATRQSEIVKELQERGIPLHESLIPPQVIDK